MDVFTEVYDKSRQLLQTQCFDKRWSNIEAKLKGLLDASGPDSGQADVLDLVRKSLMDSAKGSKNYSKAIAQEIVALVDKSKTGYRDRAALLKMFKHLYFVERKGKQSIWVVDHPKAYLKWCYDTLDGLSEDKVLERLERNGEAFGADRRKLFSNSLQISRKWSSDALVKLDANAARTQRVVKRWFLDGTATDADYKNVVTKLKAGFKDIAAACNSTSVIFSDRPHKRADKSWYKHTYASVNSNDIMSVIYIYEMFYKAANSYRTSMSPLWLCAETVIHELSHKKVGTKDHAYDSDGLKPGGAGITAAQAIDNADSWGYFAVDLAGMLPKSAKNHALR
jgi:hypothetical protein